MKKLVSILGIILSSLVSQAANYYWIGGAGNWSDINHWATTSGGSTLHSFVPTPNDDVFFDAGSGFTAVSKIVTVNTNATCRNMSWNGALNIPFISGSSSFALNIYGTFLLQPTMIYEVAITNFMSNSIGNTISTNGITIVGFFNFNGTGSWILQDGLLVTRGINCNQGIFDSNNYNINAGYFKSMGSSARTVLLGNSIVTTNTSGNSFDFTGTNLSLSASASTLILNYNNPGVNSVNQLAAGTNNIFGTIIFNFSGSMSAGTGNLFNNLLFKKNGSLYNSVQFNTLTFTPGNSYELEPGMTYTINNLFNASPSNICLAWTSITLPYFHRGSTRANVVMPATATVNISNCAIQNINVTGGAVFTATNSVDDGNNLGWTFLSPSSNNLYWIGGAGNWSDGSHWATTSGGVPSGCIPGASTNVFFDINSGLSAGSETITVNTVQNCRNLTCIGSVVPPQIVNPTLYAGILNIYGSVILQSGMIYNVKTLFKSSSSETIQCNTAQFNAPETDYSVFFIGTGSWTLSDDFSTQGIVLLGRGTLSTNNYSVNVGSFSSTTSFPSTTRNLILGSSVINVNAGNWAYYSGNLNAGTSHIIFTNNSSNYMVTAGSSHTYYNVTFNHPGSFGSSAGTNFNKVVFKSNGEIQFGFRYNELHFSPNCTYKITGTQTITALFNSNTPSCGGWATINGGTLSMPPSATVNVNQAILQNVTAIGGAIFTASNSIDVSGNTGWSFGAVTTNSLYWVGGSGDWNDATHWSTVNNGIYPSTNPCVPGPGDDVFFNANSGLLSSSRTVSITASVYCHDITCAGSSIAPQIIGTANLGYLNIYGSTVLQSGGTYNVGFVFKSPNAETITSNGAIYISGGAINLTGKITFDGTGSWTLLDDFNAPGMFIHFIKGTINTNNHDVYCHVFGERASGIPAPTTTLTTRHLTMGSSNIFLSGFYNSFVVPWEYAMVNSSINAGTGHIIINNLNNAATQFRTNSTQTYYDVTFSGLGTYEITGSGSNFHNVIFLTNGEMQGNHTYNELTFTGRYTYRLQNGFIQTVTSNFYPSGNPCFITFIRSTTNGTRGTINVQAGNVNYDYVDIQDIDATPSFATFNIAGHSTNSGNNLNMIFAPTTTVALSGLGSDITLCQNTLPITLNTTNFYPNPVTTFSWTGGITTNSLSVTTGGNYSVAVRYASDCIVGDGIIVTANPNPTVAIGGSAVTCNGAAATLTASGASTYTWTSPTVTTNTLTVNPASNTTYSVVGTSTAGCVSQQSVITITVSASPTVAVSSVSSPTICSGNTSTIAPSGASTYTLTSATQTLTSAPFVVNPTATTTYTLNGTSSLACPSNNNVQQTITVNTLPTVAVSSVSSPTICSGNTSTITPSGASTYTLTSATQTLTTAPFVVNPTAITTYTLNGTSSLACPSNNSVQQTITVNTLPTLSISSQTNVSCFGFANGAVNLLPSGGSGSGYTITPTSTSNLSFGTYTYNLLDGNSCTTSTVVSINQPTANLTSVINGTTANTSCTSANGTASITLTGGTPSYTVNWDNGFTGDIISNLDTGIHTYTVTDANGCSNNTGTVNISGVTGITTNAVSQTSVSCFGATTGALSYTTSGGATHTYTLTGTSTSYTNTTGVFTNLIADTYTLVAMDDVSGCIDSKITTVSSPSSSITLTGITTTTALCNGDLGVVTVTVSGGTSGYNYNWSSNPSTINSATYTAGVYSLTVTDLNNCSLSTQTFVITEPALLTVLVTNTAQSGCGLSSGGATVTAIGGTSPYFYTWETSTTSYTTNIPTTNSLSVGSNSVSIIDGNGCISTSTVITIVSYNAPVVTTTVTDVACYGDATGSIVTNVSSSSAYTYTWSNGLHTSGLNSVSSGIYTLTVADINNCKTITEITIEEPDAPLNIVLSNSTQAVCGKNNGSISAEAIGGTPVYQYAWNTGTLNSNTINDIQEGDYTLIVTDLNGCKDTLSITLRCKLDLVIPEVFTPNGDGKNDKFEIKAIGDYPNTSIQIFNRWGSLVYMQSNYNNEWDGKPNVGDAIGKNILPAGTYFVVLEFGDGKTETYKGYVMIEY